MTSTYRSWGCTFFTYEYQNISCVPHLLPKEDDDQDQDVADDAQDDDDGEDDGHEPGHDEVELSLAARRGVVVEEVHVREVVALILAPRDVQVQVVEGAVR